MIMALAHTLLYALIQTMIFAMFALSLQRLKKCDELGLVKAFFYILMVNAAGTVTFGESVWQLKSRPVAAGIFLLGMLFFIAAHIYLLWQKIFKK